MSVLVAAHDHGQEMFWEDGCIELSIQKQLLLAASPPVIEISQGINSQKRNKNLEALAFVS